MTSARCWGGITALSVRRPPRNATPKPAPPISEPTQNSAGVSVPAARTIAIMPVASASEPPAAPAQGAVRPNASCAAAPAPARAKTPSPATRWLSVWKRLADSAGPRERNRPPIDQLETTASAARKNGRRTLAGTWGFCGVRRGLPVLVTGSGIRSAPAKAIANSTSRTT